MNLQETNIINVINGEVKIIKVLWDDPVSINSKKCGTQKTNGRQQKKQTTEGSNMTRSSKHHAHMTSTCE